MGLLLTRSDALNNARSFLEDMPEDAAPGGRWFMVDALAAAGRAAAEEFERYKEELGLTT